MSRSLSGCTSAVLDDTCRAAPCEQLSDLIHRRVPDTHLLVALALELGQVAAAERTGCFVPVDELGASVAQPELRRHSAFTAGCTRIRLHNPKRMRRRPRARRRGAGGGVPLALGGKADRARGLRPGVPPPKSWPA